MKKETLVVVGNGMTGYKFCEKLVSKNLNSTFEIIVFGEENEPAYDRVHLTDYYNGASKESLLLAPTDWYAENNLDLKLGERIVNLDVDSKVVTSNKGTTVHYDKLVFATGAGAFVPVIEGVEKEGVFVYRTLDDLDKIKAYAKTSKKAAVIGGGLLGLEAARALMREEIDTHVIEFADRLMPRQLDNKGAEYLKTKLEALGLNIHLSKNTKLIDGEGKITQMCFADETNLETDMLVISAGIKPRDEVAKDAGLEVHERGGIVVDSKMNTSADSVYAIGECANVNGQVFGLVTPCYDMADVLVSNLSGETKDFSGFDMSATKLKLIRVDVGSFGDALGNEDHHPIVIEDPLNGIYKRLNVSKDGKRLLGGVLVGDASDYNMLLQKVRTKAKMPENIYSLLVKGGNEEENNSVLSLPDDAVLCSCENKTKGDICSAIKEDGLTKIAEVKKCTKAGTGCGGCLPMVDSLLKETLKSQGHTIRNTICEHFDYTRQELFDFIKVEEIKNFYELIEKHGTGAGCEICKPVVASLLASIWNEHVTEHDMIQDTNDRFLANIQKGGSYSVVPRIPGGEITPKQLITIGQIARKHNLYCKITGGQRIDMFGVRMEELLEVWDELIAAGFESGHAYGKSLRTVKSCVGSTWCRFGQQDSVTFAIDIENRYKGLRGPHKIKGGVSGCIRECAEARGKDFGIIATEKGWNLYVCGNGGATPKHAQLLAADVDTETCIKYLDRFLIFYIKTAEPLMRTSKWLDSLEGGLEHLIDVVVKDTLGMGEKFEAEMQQLVDTYECEWKKVVENPELRKRFKPFINDDKEDDSIQFVDHRGQKRPKLELI